jgi:hypothetical protein
MTNETLTLIKPALAVLFFAVAFVVLMRVQYIKSVKSILSIILVWLGIKHTDE